MVPRNTNSLLIETVLTDSRDRHNQLRQMQTDQEIQSTATDMDPSTDTHIPVGTDNRDRYGRTSRQIQDNPEDTLRPTLLHYLLFFFFHILWIQVTPQKSKQLAEIQHAVLRHMKMAQTDSPAISIQSDR